MSGYGRLKRGFKWYSQRDVKGELPEATKKDSVKMGDVDFYLGYCKSKKIEQTVVDEGIVKLRNLERFGKIKTTAFSEELKLIGLK